MNMTEKFVHDRNDRKNFLFVITFKCFVFHFCFIQSDQITNNLTAKHEKAG